MRSRFALKAAVLALLAIGGASGRGAGRVPVTKPDRAGQERSLSGSSLAEVPFELNSNKPLVRVRVNGSEPSLFLLDTGSVTDAVDVDRAKALGMTLKGGEPVSGAGEGSVASFTASDVSLRLGELELPKDDVDVLPLRSAFSPSEGRAIDGVLGYPLFRRFVVEIDYGKGLVRIRDPRKYEYSGPGEAIPLQIVRGNILTSAKLAVAGGKQFSGQFLVDTCWRSALSLAAPLVTTRNLLGVVHTIEATTGVGIGGPTEDAVGRVESLRLGKFTIRRPVANFSRAKHGILSQSDLAGIIDGDILRRFRVAFDYPHKRMILEPGAAFEEPYEFDMSGLFLVADAQGGGSFRIYQVIKGSPAFEAGLRVEDVIETMQGLPTENLTLERARQMLRRGPGAEVKLAVRRGERRFETTIRLRRLV